MHASTITNRTQQLAQAVLSDEATVRAVRGPQRSAPGSPTPLTTLLRQQTN